MTFFPLKVAVRRQFPYRHQWLHWKLSRRHPHKHPSGETHEAWRNLAQFIELMQLESQHFLLFVFFFRFLSPSWKGEQMLVGTIWHVDLLFLIGGSPTLWSVCFKVGKCLSEPQRMRLLFFFWSVGFMYLMILRCPFWNESKLLCRVQISYSGHEFVCRKEIEKDNVPIWFVCF